MSTAGDVQRRLLLRLEASACQMELVRDHQGLLLETELYVSSERQATRVTSLAEVVDLLRQTQLPFCEVIWLAPPAERPGGWEQLEGQVVELVEHYLETASQVQFTM